MSHCSDPFVSRGQHPLLRSLAGCGWALSSITVTQPDMPLFPFTENALHFRDIHCPLEEHKFPDEVQLP